MATAPSDLDMVIEEAIDAGGISAVIDALVRVCFEKAEHLRSNWQDNVSARSWERDARKLDRIKTEN